MRREGVAAGITGLFMLVSVAGAAVAVDTGQSLCYSNYSQVNCPSSGAPFYGQDAQYMGAQPAYRDNGDGTVTDLNTGLMWSKGLDGHKVTPEEAKQIARNMTLGGHNDWRVPTIKELYSLIDFRGYAGFSGQRQFNTVPSNAVPFINTDYFDFAYGDVSRGERYIDAQWLSSTHYVSTTMGGMDTVFGVNFADGRIKGYGYKRRGTSRAVKTFYARYVRGKSYGNNSLVDNGNGTISDRSSGLMWTKKDSGKGMKWVSALGYCEALKSGGYDDWRLPNAKELQYIVDYRRSPDKTKSAAIDPVFKITLINNEAKQVDYPFFWSSTTHLDGPRPGGNAAYVAFGRAIGQMNGRVMDVHGAGAQRSDPKSGKAAIGHGPQGDAQRVESFARCVRGGLVKADSVPPAADSYPNKIRLLEVHDNTGKQVLGHEAMKLNQQGAPSMQGQTQGGLPPQIQRIQPLSDPNSQIPQIERVQPAPAQGSGFVARLDRDGDGRVSREEFDGPPDRFDFHDINQDGYLTEEEAPRMPPGGRPAGM